MRQNTMSAEGNQIDLAPKPRSLIVEIIGTIVSMAGGAFVGLMTGGNGLGRNQGITVPGSDRTDAGRGAEGLIQFLGLS